MSETRQPTIRVLLVEDNAADARLLAESLRDAGPGAFHVTHVTRLSAAIEALARDAPPDVIALDLSLPDSSGLATARRVQDAAPGIPVVILTGLHDERLALEAVRQGVQDYLVKGQSEAGPAARALRYAVERARIERERRAAEELLRTITDAAPALIGYVDPDGVFRLNNRAYEQWFGQPSGSLTGRHVEQVLGPDAWRKVRRPLGRALAGEAVRFEDLLPYAGGGPRWVSVTYTPDRGPDGGAVRGVVILVTDISQIKAAEQALRENEARLSAVVGTAVDAIITIDDRGVIDSANPATERMFGYALEELAGRNVSMLMPEPYAGEHDGYMSRYLRTGEARIIGVGRDVIGLRKDGTTFPLTLSVSEFHVGQRRMFTGILHDISNRRRLEREILEASAAEQRRIGHDLHDGLCQQILGVSFGVEVLAKRLENTAPKEVSAVRKLEELLNDTLKQARALSHGLNPIDVRAGGLAKALHDLCVRVTDAFHVKCQFEGETDGDLIDDTSAIHLYRIAQESISNAIKHGRAKHIRVALSGIQRGGLTLAITDDGRGLPAEPNPRAGRGLHIMQYRAAIIGATLAVRPVAKGGVAVTCSLRIASSVPDKPIPQVSPAKPPRATRPRRR